MKRSVAAAGLAALIAASGPAPPSLAEESPVFDPGPALGSVLPALNLPDQAGRNRALADLAGPQGLLLLVYRSADW